jgi:hypothetical protein
VLPSRPALRPAVAATPSLLCRRRAVFPSLIPLGLRRPPPGNLAGLRLRRPPDLGRHRPPPDLGLRLRDLCRAVRRQRLSVAAFFTDPPSTRGGSPSPSTAAARGRDPRQELRALSRLGQAAVCRPLVLCQGQGAVLCQGQRPRRPLQKICTVRRCCGQGHGSATSLLPPAASRCSTRLPRPGPPSTRPSRSALVCLVSGLLFSLIFPSIQYGDKCYCGQYHS